MPGSRSVVVGISFTIGLIAIILGVIGLATPTWLKIIPVLGENTVVYGLFRQCATTVEDDITETICTNVTTFKTTQGLQIAGIVIIGIGIIIAILLKLFPSTGNIYLISPLLPMIGSILILIGFLLYTKYVIEHFTAFLLQIGIGYSMILMVIACISGFIASIYFSFNAGYTYRNNRETHSTF